MDFSIDYFIILSSLRKMWISRKHLRATFNIVKWSSQYEGHFSRIFWIRIMKIKTPNILTFLHKFFTAEVYILIKSFALFRFSPWSVRSHLPTTFIFCVCICGSSLLVTQGLKEITWAKSVTEGLGVCH